MNPRRVIWRRAQIVGAAAFLTLLAGTVGACSSGTDVAPIETRIAVLETGVAQPSPTPLPTATPEPLDRLFCQRVAVWRDAVVAVPSSDVAGWEEGLRTAISTANPLPPGLHEGAAVLASLIENWKTSADRLLWTSQLVLALAKNDSATASDRLAPVNAFGEARIETNRLERQISPYLESVCQLPPL